jgi:murein DD-endopeptidase MepM/ murein hydrolase activator NlpD
VLDVRRWIVRRRIAVLTVVTLMAAAASATEAPGASARPGQEDPSSGSESDAAAQQGVLDIEVDVANDEATTVTQALQDIDANVADQLAQLQNAQLAVVGAINTLAERDAAIVDTELRIEDLTERTDQVVIDAYTSPPADAALDALLTQDAVEASLKQALVDMQADRDAATLSDLQAAREDLVELREAQEEAAADADQARADAEAALAELEGAVDQRTQFILDVRARVDRGQGSNDPALADEIAQLSGALQDIEAEEARREAEAALERARQEAIRRGDILCPVEGGGLHFTDTWGAARSGGRTHKGTDMFASTGTPTPAPTNGRVEYRNSGLGGMAWYVYGTNGHTYYGAHLSEYGAAEGYVEAGTIIGYVGHTGNADASSPHLHFEFHPGGGEPVNPYSLLDRACPSH